jgi:hypothetical protein
MTLGQQQKQAKSLAVVPNFMGTIAKLFACFCCCPSGSMPPGLPHCFICCTHPPLNLL